MNFNKLILLFLILFTHLVGKAQKTFAPDGAHWHHEMAYGSFHSYVYGDSVMQGVPVKVIKRVALVRQPYLGEGLRVNNLGDLYVYDAIDTVFVYNHRFNRYTPLYVFNANENDAICLPIPPSTPGEPDISTDSTFCFVIDSIRIMKYDTSNLKAFFTRSLGDPLEDDQVFNWGGKDDFGQRVYRGAYAEKIGGIYSGIIPSCFNCSWLASEAIQDAGAIRCYSDPEYSIKLIEGECNAGGIATTIKETIAIGSGIQIFPNPANDFIHIKISAPDKVNKIELMNAVGENIILTHNYDKTRLDISHVSEGVYFLRVHVSNDNKYIEKVLIRR